jgi:hypothetical protein
MASLLRKTKQNLMNPWMLAGLVGGIAYISAKSTWTPAHVGFALAGIAILAVLMLVLNNPALNKPIDFLLTAGLLAYLGYEIIAHEHGTFIGASAYAIALDVLIVSCVAVLLGSAVRKIRNRQR